MIDCNYKVNIKDIQNKYRFKIFCAGSKYDDTEIKERLNTAEENIETLQGQAETSEIDIEVLQTKVAEQESIINQMPQVSDSGTSATLNNVIKTPFRKFEVEGNSEQNGEPSPENEVPIKSAGDNENLCDMSTATINYNGNTALSITGQMLIGNGTPRATNVQLMEKDITEIVQSKKQVYCTYKLFNGEFNEVIRVNVLNSNNSVVDRISLPCILNYTEGYTYKLIILSSFTLNTFDFKMGIKLEQGTVATPYSPYGMGSITEKIVNKNWFNKNSTEYVTPSNLTTVNSIDTGVRVTSIYAGTNTTARYKIMDLRGFEGKTIQIKTKAKSSSTNPAFIYVRTIDKDIVNSSDNIVSSSTTLNGILSIQYTVPATLDERYHYLGLSLYGTREAQCQVGDYVDYTELQIEIGSTATDYVPHEEQTYTIPTQQPFRSIGDVRDVFFKNTPDSPYYDSTLTLNAWYERHLKWFRVTKDMIKGSGAYGVNSWVIGTPTLVKYIANTISCKCNYFRGVSHDDRTTAGNNIAYSIPSGTNIEFRNTEFSTRELFEAFLDDNEVYIEYIPVEPTYLPCTEEQIAVLENKPETYAGQTNVYSEDEVKAYLEVAGLYDLNNLIIGG